MIRCEFIHTEKDKMQDSFLKRLILCLSATGLLFGSLAAHAGITYHVDRAVGTGTITGTIETNGNMGPISDLDIISFSFQVYDGTDIVEISSAAGGFAHGDAWSYLTATATDLQFDFDGALADPGAGMISFHGPLAGTHFADYNLLANFLGRLEQLVHRHDGPEHIVSSPRAGIVVIARTENTALDCSVSPVKMGEVMAGFQAGFTGGSHTEVGNPADFFMTLGGETRRGFIIPENGDSSAQCENDFILVGGFIGSAIERPDGSSVRKPKEARDLVSSGFDGLIAGQRFEVDGVLLEHMNTASKIGFHPNGARLAVMTSGVILEPYSQAPGIHTATVIYDVDGDRDGIVDFEMPYTTSFTIHAAPAD